VVSNRLDVASVVDNRLDVASVVSNRLDVVGTVGNRLDVVGVVSNGMVSPVGQRVECLVYHIMEFQDRLLVAEQLFIPFLREVSRPVSQCIRFPTCVPRSVNDSEIKREEEFRPVCYLMVEEVGGHEIFQVLVVAKNLD